MAVISKEKWTLAKDLFLAGRSLSFISSEVGIGKSSISEKSKKEGWKKGVNEQLAIEAARVAVSKANLSEQQANILDKDVEQLSKDELMIRQLTNSNMVGVSKKLINHEELSMFDHKNAQDLIDKASVTLGVNERHSKPVQVNQNNQTLNNFTDDQLDAKIEALTLVET